MSATLQNNVALLLLAAGNSTRMHQPKQVLPWKGSTLIENALKTAEELTDAYEVVLGAHLDEISPLVPTGKVVVNEQWHGGMGISLAKGVASLERKYDPTAILVMLVDQPFLELEHYLNLIRNQLQRPSHIFASTYNGQPGVPAIFPKSFFKELMTLGADFGAKKLMKRHKNVVECINTYGELIDLDTPEDYRLACSRVGG